MLAGSALCAALYVSPLLQGPWDFILCWDDAVNFMEHEAIQVLDWPHLRSMFASVRINVHEPMANLLKAVVIHMWGLNSQAVRLVSLVLHGVTAFVLWAASTNLVTLTTQTDPSRASFGCAISSLIFFIHPLHVEVVAWPSAQPYTLALCFTSMAFLLHTWTISRFMTSVKSLQLTTRDYFDYFATTVLYACAALSKSIAVPVPVGIVLMDMVVYLQYWRSMAPLSRRFMLQYCIANMGFLAVGSFVMWSMHSANRGGADWFADPLCIPFRERLAKLPVMLTHMGGQLLWPSDLRPHYQIRPGEMDPATNPTCILGMIFFVLVTVGVMRIASTQPAFLAAWAYVIIMVLPVSGLVQHGIITLTADRYAYFPSAVVVPLLGTAIAKLATSRSVTALTLLAVALYAKLSAIQMETWRSDETLWTHSIRHDPSDWRVLDHMAEYYAKVGQADEGLPYWELSLIHLPTGGLKTRLQQAKLLMFLRRYDEGCSIYQSLLGESPQSIQVLNNMAICYLLADNLELGKAMMKQAISVGIDFSGERSNDATPSINLEQLEHWDSSKNFQAQLMW
ncbi:hypothetical protein LEN26_010527 [Aphanomyces euteiches]|nr:hypothetical protein AeMF1_009610 [Aphanomyces euteiches]KAH9121804.1 hypothetical protein LEN26_010527 [Aphanomyces euteiches]KAH9198015.1 hypothetical protein AeNC1_000022 [Aphanomyces euteiches]